MSNEIILNPGVKIALQTTGGLVNDGSIVECVTAHRQSTDNPGYTLGIFEFESLGGFSVAPQADAAIELYEQKINSGANDAPDVSLDYEQDFIGDFKVSIVGGIQYPSLLLPIHRYGGKYWIKWTDGGSGSADLSAGWALSLTPCAYGN